MSTPPLYIEIDDEPIPLANEKTFYTQRQKLAAAGNTLDELPDYGVKKDKLIQQQEKSTTTPHELLIAEATGHELPVETVRGILKDPEKVREARRLINDFDGKVVDTAVSLRNYVTTRLVLESDHKDPKIRMQALIALGKITDVGLFTERSEVVHTNKTVQELEANLREKLTRLLNPMTNVEDATIRRWSPDCQDNERS